MWASGIFDDMQAFIADEEIACIINCLTGGSGKALAIEEPLGRLTRLQESMKDVATSLVNGENVLVHCKHGIHRR